MSDRLFDVEPDPPAGRPLGSRQHLALLLVTGHSPVSAEYIGRELHASKPDARCSCFAGEACEWAEPDGKTVLRSLQDRGLVVRARDGWRLAGVSEKNFSQTDDIPY